jgi:tetratricopeptide (TPR) repeat protein
MADKKDDTKGPAGMPAPVRIGDESLGDRLAPHIMKILVGVVVIAVVVTIVLAFRWRKRAGQEDATTRLAQVLAVGQKPVVPGMVPTPDKPNDDQFATSKDRAIAMLAAMAKANNDGSPAYKGTLLLEAGKVDEAIAEFRTGTAAKDILGVLSREGLGLGLEAKAAAEKDNAAAQKLYEEALAAFTSMQPDAAGPRRAYALYHQGRMQQQLNKKAEAKALYEQAKELGAATELPELIDRRLATL